MELNVAVVMIEIKGQKLLDFVQMFSGVEAPLNEEYFVIISST